MHTRGRYCASGGMLPAALQKAKRARTFFLERAYIDLADTRQTTLVIVAHVVGLPPRSSLTQVPRTLALYHLPCTLTRGGGPHPHPAPHPLIRSSPSDVQKAASSTATASTSRPRAGPHSITHPGANRATDRPAFSDAIVPTPSAQPGPSVYMSPLPRPNTSIPTYTSSTRPLDAIRPLRVPLGLPLGVPLGVPLGGHAALSSTDR